MKIKAFWILSTVFFGVISCQDKKDGGEDLSSEKTTEVIQEAVEEVIEKVESAVIPSSVSLEERAAKLGFAKFLSSDTEAMWSVYNAQQSYEQLKSLQLVEVVRSTFGGQDMGAIELEAEEMLEAEQGDEDEADALGGAASGAPDQWMLLGQEVTIAFGPTSGEQIGNLLTVNSRTTYFQAAAMGQAVHAYAESGDSSQFVDSLTRGLGPELIGKLLEDPEAGTELLEALEMPPLYLAFRAKDGELEQAAQLLNSGMGFIAMLGEMVAPVEFETGGSAFSGYQVLGEQIAKQMEAARDSLEATLSPATVNAMIAAVAKKNLIVASGTVGDYVVMVVGGDEKAFRLEAEMEKSLVASDRVEFMDDYIDKQLISTSCGKKEMLQTLIEEAGGISSYALGFREGISEGNSLGETRDIEEMLRLIADREKAFMALGSSEDVGMVAYLEEGVKVETIGGYDKAAVDWDAETKLAHLGDAEDTLMFLNIPSNAAYNESLSDYLEVIFETAYAMAMKFSELGIENPDPEIAEAMGYAKLFDEKFRQDVLGIYHAMSGPMAEGLGQETALIIDLNGSVPAVPNVPEAVIKEAKAPRITLIKPVNDREKIATAWKVMDSHLSTLLPNLSELLGEKIPMQKPISSQADDLTTWFIALPFLQDDFLPSVTLSDEWFAASTSKSKAVDLVNAAQAGGESGEGVKWYINFTALTEYADAMLKLVDKNAAEIFEEEADLTEFNADKAEYQDLIDATREFDSLSWTIRKEDGSVRNRIHFKTK